MLVNGGGLLIHDGFRVALRIYSIATKLYGRIFVKIIDWNVLQEWYLYKYLESEKKEVAKDRADPTLWRATVTVRCKAARRCMYFVWNIFSVTVSTGVIQHKKVLIGGSKNVLVGPRMCMWVQECVFGSKNV